MCDQFKGFLLALSLVSSFSQGSELEIQTIDRQSYVVFKPKSLAALHLALNDQKGKPLRSFVRWQKQLPTCQTLSFAMNAGMYHANYQPVGLYIENKKILQAINQDRGVGNFFLQPNGILAWNHQSAKIYTTAMGLNSNFDADYATQSGPILVLDGKIMSYFIKMSDSKKIRNGVGIKEGQLYFVMSQQRVNFYEFAKFFKDNLKVEQALYLDGSISSIYVPKMGRNDRAYSLGPMLGYIDKKC